jgi:hypothetical protein
MTVGTTEANIDAMSRELLHASAEAVARADCGMAHMIRTVRRHDIGWDVITETTGLTQDDAEGCMARWPGGG